MNVKGTLVNIDDAVIDAAKKEGYRKGWNDRRLHDSGMSWGIIHCRLIAVVAERIHEFSELIGNIN